MARIRVLPEQIANQIAAGEVVERPASVVKELIENSLDAGARRIEIEIEGSGTGLIRILDDGEGMDEDDLLMCLERHGTSKIRTEQDLGEIDTLGFRGEAIPSIGSVSRLTISSRPRDKDLGFLVALQFGKLVKAHETGCKPGTLVEVRNLFGNTPARKKFLRTARTEQGHIEEVVKNYALACPDITFQLRIGGRESLRLDSSLTEQRRLGIILRYDGDFLPISFQGQGSEGRRSLRGYLIPPERVSPGPARLRIFVNNRVIRDRMINHGVAEGMRGFLLKGKNPAGLLHLTLPPGEVDVNVHPAKHEVRFRNSREIHLLISQAVQKAMQDYQKTVKQAVFGHPEPPPTRLPEDLPVAARSNSFSLPSSTPASETVPPFTSARPDQEPPTLHEPSPHEEPEPPSTETAQSQETQPLFRQSSKIGKPATAPRASSSSRVPFEPSHPQTETGAPSGPEPAGHGLRIIGQYDDLYIFCQSPQGLVVIDQHAAHERLLYEKFHRQYLHGTVPRQSLMFPESVDLSIFQAQLVEKNFEELERMGFRIREFGGNTFVISAIPALAGHTSPTELFLDVLEKFGSESTGNSAGGILEDVLASMACKAAVKAGTGLSEREMESLLDEMARADLFSHCPHGRPVVKTFSPNDIKKWFYRT